MIKIKKALIIILPLFILILPMVSFAGGLVPPCEMETNVPKGIAPQCVWGFTQFMGLVNNVISFVLFKLLIPIAAIVIAYAGFLFLTSMGNPGKRTKAKELFLNVVIGLLIAVGAWLIIRTVLTLLGYDGAWIGF